MKRLLMVLLSISVVGSSVFSCPALAVEKPIKWRADSVLMATSGEGKNFQWFCDQVKKRTNGRLIITLYPGCSLGIPVTQLYRALKAGTIEMAMGHPEFQQGDAPEMSLQSRFGIWSNHALRLAVQQYLDPLRKKIFEEDWDIILLSGHLLYNSYCGVVSNEDVRGWNDLQGKKIRVSSEDDRQVYKRCGASPIFMPLSETYQALKTGVIDGIDTGPRSVVERSLFEVAKHYAPVYFPGTGGTWSCEYIVSEKHWNKLPDDIQRIVQDCAIDAMRKANCEATDPRTERAYLEKMKKHGMTINPFSEEDMEKSHVAAVYALVEFMKETKSDRAHEIYNVIKPFLPIP